MQRQLQEQRERNLELQKQLEKMQIEKNSYRKKAEEPKKERNRNKWAENVVAELATLLLVGDLHTCILCI